MIYEIDNLLITGNGFDMDLGLETSYSKFIESEEWKNMRNYRKQEYSSPSLIDFIENRYKSTQKGGWFDLEGAILDYVLPNAEGHFVDNAEEDKKDYNALCNALVEYLCNLFWTPSPSKVAIRMSDSYAGDLLYAFFDPLLNSYRNVLYTFNYTPLEVIYSNIGGWPTTAEYCNIHGRISKDDFFKKQYDGSSIILGIMTDEMIAPEYSFLIKSNHPKYCLSNIEKDLVSARSVYIFGHSLNPIDFGYFKSYFEMLESNADKERELIFITKDDNSMKKLFDNLCKMGVSIEGLEEHVNITCKFTYKL